MPTPTKGKRLGGSPAHQRLMLANLATSLFEHGRITTTETKAKRLRPYAERLISIAKRGDLAARRRVAAQINNKTIVHELFTEIAPAMANREGGYTRITKIGARKGDNAPMVVIELVLEPVSPKQAVVKEAEKAAKKSAPAEQTIEANAEESAEETNVDAAEATEQEQADTEEATQVEEDAPEAVETAEKDLEEAEEAATEDKK